MNLKIKKIISFVLSFVFILSLAQVLSVNTSSAACDGANASDETECNYGLIDTLNTKGLSASLKKTDTPETVIGKIVGAGLAFIGVLFFILMIYAGFLWMTARGNDEQIKKSIDLMTQASIGFAIVAAAYVITKFVGQTIINSFI